METARSGVDGCLWRVGGKEVVVRCVYGACGGVTKRGSSGVDWWCGELR